MISYITYDVYGNTTGAYLQDLCAEHVENHVEATPSQLANWLELYVISGVLVSLFQTLPPVINPVTQTVVRDGVEFSENQWQYKWRVDALSAAAIEAKRVASIPSEISPRQIRQALTATALRSSVEAAVAAADQDTKDWWEFATTFERAHPRVIGMAQALGVTPRQMDDLWVLGGSK